ncbi:MAG TPA: carbohydrate kinase family protein [Clostridia bacterium]|nr:carbohydrate kinase family protein [Clostridia bacterium]
MKQGIALAGNLTVDHIKTVESYPLEGNLTSILSLEKFIGGAPVNVGIGLSKMDNRIPITVTGVVGSDGDGEFIIERLRENGIDINKIKRDSTAVTSFTDVITAQSTGNRTFFHYRGANELLGVEHFNFSELAKARILHMGYALLLDSLDESDPEYGTVMARVLAMAQGHGIKTSLDVISEKSDRYSKIIPYSLKHCNYFIVNEFESSQTTGIPHRDNEGRLIVRNMRAMCERLLTMGVNDLVVIHAPEGGFAMDVYGNYYEQPSLKLPKGYIKGAVGAGDAFCAGVLYGLYMDWDIQRALRLAVSAAACCLSQVNATDGMVEVSAAEKLYENMGKQDL